MHQFIWKQRHRTNNSKAGSHGITGNSSPRDACVLGGLTVVTASQSNALDKKAAVGQGIGIPEKKFCELPLPLPAWVQRTGLGLENWVRARLGRPLCQRRLISPSRTHAYSRTGALTQQLGTHTHLSTPGPVLRATTCKRLEATRASARTSGFLQLHIWLP